jgi:hypothetical protein
MGALLREIVSLVTDHPELAEELFERIVSSIEELFTKRSHKPLSNEKALHSPRKTRQKIV